MKRNHVLIALVAFAFGWVLAYAAAGDIMTWTGVGSRRNTVEFKIASSTVGSAADLVPGTTNTNSVGRLGLEMKDGYFATTLAIPSNAAPRTNVTPSRAGLLIFNSAGGEVCVSTGTTVSTWAKTSSPGTACAN